MKPGEHPDFFRFAPPAGQSRESSLRLDREGRFWHDGGLVEHEALAKALHTWIAKHPDNGRYILTNGYDWTYFTVDDVPYFVTAVQVREDGIRITLSDDTAEDLLPEALSLPDALSLGEDGALYLTVKGGAFRAKFTRHAQIALEPAMFELSDDRVGLKIGDQRVELPSQPAGIALGDPCTK